MRVLLAMLVLAAATGAAAEEEDSATRIAKSRFQLGELLYTNGRYAEAAVEFEAARAIKPRPDFDYNIGRCREHLGDWHGAIVAYQRYVEATPTPLDVDVILQRISELRAREQAAPPAAPSPESSSTSPARPRGRAARIAGVVLGVVGVASLGLGIGFGVAGDQSADALSARDRARLPYDASEDDQLSRNRALEGAFIGVGAAAVAAGVACYVAGWLRDRRAHGASRAERAAPVGIRF
jgi:tetratricopeptide (TPR) repeat protein